MTPTRIELLEERDAQVVAAIGGLAIGGGCLRGLPRHEAPACRCRKQRRDRDSGEKGPHCFVTDGFMGTVETSPVPSLIVTPGSP